LIDRAMTLSVITLLALLAAFCAEVWWLVRC
jgi:hypothetical protein